MRLPSLRPERSESANSATSAQVNVVILPESICLSSIATICITLWCKLSTINDYSALDNEPIGQRQETVGGREHGA